MPVAAIAPARRVQYDWPRFWIEHTGILDLSDAGFLRDPVEHGYTGDPLKPLKLRLCLRPCGPCSCSARCACGRVWCCGGVNADCDCALACVMKRNWPETLCVRVCVPTRGGSG